MGESQELKCKRARHLFCTERGWADTPGWCALGTLEWEGGGWWDSLCKAVWTGSSADLFTYNSFSLQHCQAAAALPRLVNEHGLVKSIWTGKIWNVSIWYWRETITGAMIHWRYTQTFYIYLVTNSTITNIFVLATRWQCFLIKSCFEQLHAGIFWLLSLGIINRQSRALGEGGFGNEWG